jgi:hypothetical protein
MHGTYVSAADTIVYYIRITLDIYTSLLFLDGRGQVKV